MPICIYAHDAQDFTTNGLGVLQPEECKINEQAGGMYELKIVHPIDYAGRWTHIQPGCIIKAPAPVRESPLYEAESEDAGPGIETVVRKIYKANTPRMYLRKEPKANTVKLCSLPHGTEVVLLEHDGGKWARVAKVQGGQTGWCPFGGLTFVREETETVNNQGGGNMAVEPEQSRDQLFRIYSTVQDTEDMTISAEAMHVFYDQRGNLIDAEYAPENALVAQVIAQIEEKLLNENPFAIHAENISGKITADYSFLNPVEALLDPDQGIVGQTGALLLRDNYETFLLPDKIRDRGVTIRRGKNLIGVNVTTDDSNVITRIIPVGKDEDGEPLYIEGRYVDSPRVNEYPYIRAARIEYDVSVGDPDEDNADKVFKTKALARAELERLAKLDFENGADMPEYGMDVEFVLLQNTAEYEKYASLQAVHLYDTVTVIDEMIGLKAKLRVTAYEWDCIAKQYDSITLGKLEDVQRTVYSFNLPDGSVGGNKIAPESLHAASIAAGSIGYDKLSADAIAKLTGGALSQIRSGRTDAGSCAPGSTIINIGFGTAFSNPPNVICTAESGGNVTCGVAAGSVTESGFSARVINNDAQAQAAAIRWIAY